MRRDNARARSGSVSCDPFWPNARSGRSTFATKRPSRAARPATPFPCRSANARPTSPSATCTRAMGGSPAQKCHLCVQAGADNAHLGQSTWVATESGSTLRVSGPSQDARRERWTEGTGERRTAGNVAVRMEFQTRQSRARMQALGSGAQNPGILSCNSPCWRRTLVWASIDRHGAAVLDRTEREICSRIQATGWASWLRRRSWIAVNVPST